MKTFINPDILDNYMITKEILGEIVRLQKLGLEGQSTGVPRELLEKLDMKAPHALIISGIRRCGKSTLLKQLIKKFNKPYYFNFEDQRAIDFEVGDFEKLNEVFQEEYGANNYYFLDEVQNVKGWERFVRKMQDMGKKFIITGSNASLLSKELGTKLTGRHLNSELFPFSYAEMLKFKRKTPSLKSFKEYLNLGGFPEYLKYKNEAILQEIFEDIILRDVAVRYSLKNIKHIKDLAIYLLTNVGREFSYNKLKKLFNFGSVNTIISYINYFENSYLLFTIPLFSRSFKKQLINPKKVYAIDTGFARVNSVSLSKDSGRLLENLIFLNLRMKSKEIYYFKKKYECDFLLKEKGAIKEAIQVCYELNEENQEREINGLKEAMLESKLKKGKIITLNQKDRFDGIEVIPAWEYLAE